MAQEISDIMRSEVDLDNIHYDCNATVAQLIQEGHIERVFSEEEIKEKITAYLAQHKPEILKFLGENGKVLVPMNSAEKFADIVIDELGISPDRVTKFKVSTYKQGVSMKQQLRDEDKENITREMGIQQGDKVLILEDLIDTGHTLRILYDFLYNHMVDVHAVCLLDKHVEEGEKVKAEMGKRLQSIIDIGQEFVIGFGMDYEYRLCADIKGLWKIKEGSIPEVKELLNVFTTRIKDILGRPDAA